ncbi:MAG: SIMPL domain-containing protein [Chloroflexi bacterium]|nr:SIMPL domain-containing protein [Chloroflexota bacterium]
MRRAIAIVGLAALALLTMASAACYDVTVEPAPADDGSAAAAAVEAVLDQVASEEDGGISVNGTGSVTVTPDIGVFDIGVEVTGETVARARSGAAEAMQKVRDSVLASGVEDRDISTRSFNIYPQYDYDREDGPPEIIGYTVNNWIEVKVRDIDRLSEVLDDALTAGGDAIRVGGISFRVDEPEQYADEARKLAVEDARARAQQLADLAGVTLGQARAISESSGGFARQGLVRAEAAFAADASTPISPGESEVSVTVHIVFAIE